MNQSDETAVAGEETNLDLEAILAEAEIDADELSEERIATAMRAIAW